MTHEKRQLLFVQGGGAGAHDEWDSKLVASLRRNLGRSYDIRYPRMPDEDDPTFAAWRTALQTELARLNDGAIIVGHSLGGTILINVLAEQPPTLTFGAIFLIAAPFVGKGGWPSDGWEPARDLGGSLPSEVPVYLYHGLADTTAPPSHAELYAKAIPQARLCLSPGRDHQFNDDLREVAAVIKSLCDPHR
jgi:predicted alpha/beta hydrolase family esterase